MSVSTHPDTHGAIGGFRLSPQQSRLWSLPGSPSAYRSQCMFVIEGSVTMETLRDAVRRVISRHEILRTTFQSLPGMTLPVQVVGEGNDFAWQTVDLGSLSPDLMEPALDAMFH